MSLRLRLATFALAMLALTDLSQTSVAQTLSADDLNKITTSLSGKALPLRGYSWEPVVGYRIGDGHLKALPLGRKELSVFSLDDVKQRHGYLELHGQQKLYVRDAAKQSVSPTQIVQPIVLVLYLADIPNLAGLSDRLEGELFYPSVEDAVASVPEWQKACVPTAITPDNKTLLPAPACNAPKIVSGPAPPRLTRQADPEIPGSLRAGGPGSWNVFVACTVSGKGKPEDVHVVIPSYLVASGGKPLSERVASDLDSNAVSAVKQYRFKPAMDGGKPVQSDLNVSINFQIFDR